MSQQQSRRFLIRSFVMESSSSKGSADEKIALERRLADAEEDLKKAKSAENDAKEIAVMNLVTSIRNQIAALQKQASESPTIESLLDPNRSNPAIIRRMNIHFSSQVSLALHQRNQQLANDTYDITESLPSLNTAEHFEFSGYQVDGPLYDGSNLTVCYRDHDNSKFILKSLSASEAKRVLPFWGKQPSNQHIIRFEFWEDPQKRKAFMLMPALPSTLEPIRFLVHDRTVTFWEHLQAALSYIHSLGFAHCDVKPSNIGISYTSDFILIDFGSISEFGTRQPSSTLPYIPSDVNVDQLRASARLDWLMLSVTMAEKCCGKSGLDIGSSRTPPLGVILDHLRQHLPPPVFCKLLERIESS